MRHFERQLSSPFRLLAAIAARTSRIEIGTGVIAHQLAADEAVREADTVLFTVPIQLGVAHNVHILDTIVSEIAPSIGWTRTPVTA